MFNAATRVLRIATTHGTSRGRQAGPYCTSPRRNGYARCRQHECVELKSAPASIPTRWAASGRCKICSYIRTTVACSGSSMFGTHKWIPASRSANTNRRSKHPKLQPFNQRLVARRRQALAVSQSVYWRHVMEHTENSSGQPQVAAAPRRARH